MSSNYREKARALVLAFVMITSVFVGTIALSGTTAADVNLGGGSDGTIDFAHDGTASANVSVSQAEQPLSTIEIGDNEGGNLAGKTILEFPNGVTISDSISTSDLIVFANKSGVEVTDVVIEKNRSRLRLDHNGVSKENETIFISGLNVTVDETVTATQDGSLQDITIRYGTGTATDTNLLRVHKPGLSSEGTPSVDVGAATSNSVVFNNTLNLTTTNASGQLASGDTISLSLNDTSEVTFNTSGTPSSDALINDSLTNGVELGTPSVSATEITVPVENESAASTRITFSNIAVDATGDATNVNFVGEIEEADGDTINVEEEGNLGFIDIQKPSFSLTNTFNVEAGRTLQGSSENITLDFSNADAPGNADIVISINDTDAVTFDTSASPINQSDLGGSNSGDIDSVTVNEGNIILTTNSSGTSGGTVNVPLGTASDEQALNVSADASDGIEFSVDVGDEFGLGASSNVVDIRRPSATLNGGSDFTLLSGDAGNESADIGATNDLTFTESIVGDSLVAGQGNNVTFTLESGTGVEFNQSASPSLLSPGDELNQTNIYVSDKSITVEFNSSASSGIDDGIRERFALRGVGLNATADATNTSVSVSVNTTDVSEDVGEIVVVEDRPSSLELNNGNDFTLAVDDTPSDGGVANESVTLSNPGVELTFGVSDDAPSGDFNVTLTLPADSGVTFDQSSSPSDGGGAVTVDTVTVVDNQTINLTVANPTVSNGDSIQLNGLTLNATEDASDTRITADINETSRASETLKLSKESQQEIQIQERIPDQLANVPGSVSVDVDSTTTVTITVQNSSSGTPFSGADVIASINDTSTGVTIDGDSTGTTDQNGNVSFDVTGGTDAGETFNLTVTLASNESISQNVTVNTQAGPPAQLDATGFQDSVALDGDNTRQDVELAAIEVRVEDSQGNLVTSPDPSVNFSSVGLNVSGSVVGFNDTDIGDKFTTADVDTVPSGDTTISDGVFYIAVERSSGTQDVSVTVASKNFGSATSSVTVFDSPGAVEAELASSGDLLTGTSRDVEYTILAGDTNEPITVSGLSVTPESSNDAVISPSSGSVSTDSSGVATASFKVKQRGTADITGIESRSNIIGRLDNNPVDTDRPTLNVTLNITEVEVENETTVEANVTFLRNDSAVDGATVNVTGSGVDVANQTTNANGTATFTVNASSTDTITVNATKAATNDATPATIDVAAAIDPIGDAANGPSDPDNDGQLEDVTGDGEFTTADVTFLFNNLNDSVIQNNPGAFDFNNENDGATESDVTALLNELAES